MPSPKTAALRFRQGKRNLDDAVVLWPTPMARDWKRSGGQQNRNTPNLPNAVLMWPTPISSRATYGRRRGAITPQLPMAVGGQLNPTWVEWLMGFPLEHIVSASLVTPLSRGKRRSPGGR